MIDLHAVWNVMNNKNNKAHISFWVMLFVANASFAEDVATLSPEKAVKTKEIPPPWSYGNANKQTSKLAANTGSNKEPSFDFSVSEKKQSIQRKNTSFGQLIDASSPQPSASKKKMDKNTSAQSSARALNKKDQSSKVFVRKQSDIDTIYQKAQAGDAKAQYEIATMFRSGSIGTIDKEQALGWQIKAANGGHSEAQYGLGVLFANGIEVDQDIEKAKFWFDKAAKNGHFAARMTLAELRRDQPNYQPTITAWSSNQSEQLEPPNPVENASDVANIASATIIRPNQASIPVGQVDADGIRDILQQAISEVAYDNRNAASSIAKPVNDASIDYNTVEYQPPVNDAIVDYNTDEYQPPVHSIKEVFVPTETPPTKNTYSLEQIRRMPAPKLLEVANSGDSYAQFLIADLYEKGAHGFDKNLHKAYAWRKRSAEQGFPESQHNLAIMYEDGKGIPQNFTQAIFWYKKAGEQGLSDAQNNLGLMYAMGKGVTINYDKAKYWFQKSAKLGNKNAQINLKRLQ